jgi:predicted metal-dependent hydrolase
MDVPGPTDAAFDRGAALFDARRFFEAHEYYEQVWKAPDIAESDRAFWKAVTQVAVGCCHAQRGNAAGAVSVLGRAMRALGGYPSPHSGIDTVALIAGARRVADEVARRPARGDIEFPRFPRVG